MDEKDRDRSAEVEPRPPPVLEKKETPAVDVSSTALRGLFILASFYTLYLARSFLLPVMLALLLSFLLKPVLRFFKKLHIAEGWGAAIILITVVSTLVLGVVVLSEPASKWVAKAPETIHNLEEKIRRALKPAAQFTRAAKEVERITEQKADDENATRKVEIKRPSMIDSLARNAGNVLLAFGEMLVLLYFLLASGDLFLRKLLRMLPGTAEKKEVVEIAREIERKISRYLATATVLFAIEGTIIGIGLAIIGMPNPVLWGVMAAVVNYIPYLGALFGISVITLVAFLHFDSVSQALLAPGIYLAVNLMDNFVSPIVQGQRLKLNPVMVFVAISFWGWLWGIVGVFLAVPILMTFKIFCDHIPALAPVGEFLSD